MCTCSWPSVCFSRKRFTIWLWNLNLWRQADDEQLFLENRQLMAQQKEDTTVALRTAIYLCCETCASREVVHYYCVLRGQGTAVLPQRRRPVIRFCWAAQPALASAMALDAAWAMVLSDALGR